MPFRDDPQDGFTASEFVWTDEFLDKPPEEQESIKQAAIQAWEDRKRGGDILGALKAVRDILIPWMKK